jgi:DNA-binding SARP family transcriptional activator
MSSLKLALLGGFRASLSSGKEVAFARRKAMLVLACLALRPGEAQTHEKMIGLLRSDRGDVQARGSFRQTLTTLRRTPQVISPPPLMLDGE